MYVRRKETDSLDKQKKRMSFLMSINHWKKNWHLSVFLNNLEIAHKNNNWEFNTTKEYK